MQMERWGSERHRIFTTHDILDESVTLIGARLGAARAVRFGRALLDSRVIEIIRPGEEVERAALALYQKFDDPEYSLTDCTSFATMRALGIDTAFSFDDHFKRAGFAILPDSDHARE
jgi:hypothetical protein